MILVYSSFVQALTPVWIFILFCKYSSNAFVVYQLELSTWSLHHKENNLIKTKTRIALLRETITLCSMAYEAITDLWNKKWTFHHCDIQVCHQPQWTSTNACPNLETSWSTYILYMNLVHEFVTINHVHVFCCATASIEIIVLPLQSIVDFQRNSVYSLQKIDM